MRKRISDISEADLQEAADFKSGDSASTDLTNAISPIGLAVGKVIRWTSNLIATGLVIVIVVTFGPELISSVLPSKSSIYADKLDIVEDWPTFQQCNLEFGDAGFQLTRGRFSGEISDVFDLLETLCREQLENDVKPFGRLGVQEKKFIDSQRGVEPVQTVQGKYRIFCERSMPMLAGFPTAIGIRDDCGQEQSADSTLVDAGAESRMSVWAMAMPIGENQWTTFIGTSAEEDSSGWIDRLIPPKANKNISLSDKLGGAVIGFAGGDIENAIEFYRGLEKEQGFELQNIQKTEFGWNASVVLSDEKTMMDWRIQMTQAKGKELTGILMKKTSDKAATNSRSQQTLREEN